MTSLVYVIKISLDSDFLRWMKSQSKVRVYRLNFGYCYCYCCYCCGHEEHWRGGMTLAVAARAVSNGVQVQAHAQAGRAGYRHDCGCIGRVQARVVWVISRLSRVWLAWFLNCWNYSDESYIYTPNLGSENIKQPAKTQTYGVFAGNDWCMYRWNLFWMLVEYQGNLDADTLNQILLGSHTQMSKKLTWYH